jgi:hypothetical protein
MSSGLKVSTPSFNFQWRELTSMNEKFHIAGIKKILIKWHKHADLQDNPYPARALYGPPPKTAAGERGLGLVDFFKQVSLFEDLTQGDLRRLARVLHKRTYRDGSTSMKRGNPARQCTSFEVASLRS